MNNNPFVPLSVSRPSSAAHPEPPSKAGTDTAPRALFRPLNGAADRCSAASHLPAEPKVTLEREGDRVTRISIQCTCGETLEFACVYEE